MNEKKLDLMQGTLDVMVLQTLTAMGPLHGYGIARRIEQISGNQVLLNQGDHLREPGPPAAARMDRRGVGHVGQSAEGQVLLHHPARRPPARERPRALGAACRT